jgi:PhnB protein
MTKAVKPVPTGYHSITPYMVVRDARKAIKFYQEAFGATECGIMDGPNGLVMHAEIQIGDSKIMLADEMPNFDSLGPQSRGGCTSSLLIYVENVDAAFDRAVKAGCTVKMPVADQFWGDRYGKLADPFGHQWSIATHVEDVSHEEMTKRGIEMAKKMATAGACN